MAIVEEINEEFARYLNRPASDVEVRRCIEDMSLSQNRTSARSCVVGTSAYAARVEREVQGAFLLLTGRRSSEFTPASFLACYAQIPVSRDNALEYVRGTAEYRDHCRKAVDETLRDMDVTLPDGIRDAFADRFVHDPEYDADKLAQDVDAGRLPPQTLQNGFLFDEDSDTAPSAESPAPDGARAPPGEPPTSPRGRGRGGMLRYVEAWETATGRRMTARQLARFYGNIPENDAETMAAAARGLDAAYSRCAGVYAEYLAEDYTRDEFEKAFIDAFDRPSFDIEFLLWALASDAYGAKMRAAICSAHRKLFADDMHPEDVGYCFDQCYIEQLGLGSERIREIVVDCKAQLSAVEETVSAVFARVLRRAADQEEVRESVAAFRTGDPAEAEARLEERLYAGLEFHDIIKARILHEYEQKHGKAMKPKLLFDVLAATLEVHSGNMRAWRVPAEYAPLIS